MGSRPTAAIWPATRRSLGKFINEQIAVVWKPHPPIAFNGRGLVHGLLLTPVSSIPLKDEITGSAGLDNVC